MFSTPPQTVRRYTAHSTLVSEHCLACQSSASSSVSSAACWSINYSGEHNSIVLLRLMFTSFTVVCASLNWSCLTWFWCNPNISFRCNSNIYWRLWCLFFMYKFYGNNLLVKMHFVSFCARGNKYLNIRKDQKCVTFIEVVLFYWLAIV